MITGERFNQLSGGAREVFLGMPHGGLEGLDEYSIANMSDAAIETSKQIALQQLKEGVKLDKKY